MFDIPKLRGHHLICLHFFNGKGYSIEFVKNLRDTLKIIEELGAKISRGADDICNKCPYLKNKRCSYDNHSNEEITEMDEFALILLKETSGTRITWHDIRDKIRHIFPSWVERYCKKCSWEDTCAGDSLYRELRYGKDNV